MKQKQNKTKRFFKLRTKLSASLILISIIPILLISMQTYNVGKISAEDATIAHLTSIADLKKNELENLIHERITEIKAQVRNIELEYLTYHEGRMTYPFETDLKFIEELNENLKIIKKNYNYENIFLTDTSRKVLASTNTEEIGTINKEHSIYTPLKNKEIYVGDLLKNSEGIINFILSSPIFIYDAKTRKKTSELLGVLVFELKAEESIYSLIGSWPWMGKTGETLLVRQEGDEILFLNELKHKENTALNLKIPLDSDIANPAIFAVQGNEGILRALDYRGEPVISAYRYIPSTNWGFVAKIDEAEALESVIELRNVIIIFSVSLIFIAILLSLFISSKITKPITKLEEAAHRISQGDFSVKPEVHNEDEIGRLAKSFDIMREKVKKSKEHLENQVENRTKELKEKLEELEKWHKHTVDRELKMVELKKKLKEFKKRK